MMEENKIFVVNQETGEIEEQTEVEQSKRLVNLRVAKVLLLGGSLFYDKKNKSKISGMNLVFLDAVETDKQTGQPVLRGFNPCITCYVKEPKSETLALLKQPVFSEKFIKISGDENFTQFHSVLSDAEIAMYRQLMGDELVNR